MEQQGGGAQLRDEDRLRALMVYMPDDPAGLARACEGVTDWAELFATARRHGLGGVLYRELVRGGATLPDAVRRDAETWSVFAQLVRERQNHLLASVLRALGDASVKAVPLKGPVLAERLYDEPWVRPTTDFDVMVCEADFPRAVEALRGVGYRPTEGPMADWYRRNVHDVPLTCEGAPLIELHVRAYVSPGIRLGSEALIARARRHRTRAGVETQVLSPEDELVYLAIHASGHQLERLVWLYDIKLLAAREPGLDWDLVARRSREAGAETMMAFAFQALREVGASLGPTVARRAGWREALAERVRRHPMRFADERWRRTTQVVAFHLALADDAVDVARWTAGKVEIRALHVQQEVTRWRSWVERSVRSWLSGP